MHFWQIWSSGGPTSLKAMGFRDAGLCSLGTLVIPTADRNRDLNSNNIVMCQVHPVLVKTGRFLEPGWCVGTPPRWHATIYIPLENQKLPPSAPRRIS